MVTSAKCCHAESHFLKTTGVAEREEREGQWRCTVSPGEPLPLRTSDLEMNEPRGHTDSPGPGGAGKPESRGELGGFLSCPGQFTRLARGRDLQEGCSAACVGPPAGPHSPPPAPQLSTSPLGSAPPPPRPGRAPLPLPGAGAPGPAEWVSAYPRARAEARPPSPSPLRAPELRWEPPRAERPESAPQPRAAPG